MDKLLATINPLNHVSGEGYILLWQHLFSGLLLGVWSRFFAVVFLSMAIWVGVRAKNYVAVLFLLGCAFLVAYGAAFLKLMGIFKG